MASATILSSGLAPSVSARILAHRLQEKFGPQPPNWEEDPSIAAAMLGVPVIYGPWVWVDREYLPPPLPAWVASAAVGNKVCSPHWGQCACVVVVWPSCSGSVHHGESCVGADMMDGVERYRDLDRWFIIDGEWELIPDESGGYCAAALPPLLPDIKIEFVVNSHAFPPPEMGDEPCDTTGRRRKLQQGTGGTGGGTDGGTDPSDPSCRPFAWEDQEAENQDPDAGCEQLDVNYEMCTDPAEPRHGNALGCPINCQRATWERAREAAHQAARQGVADTWLAENAGGVAAAFATLAGVPAAAVPVTAEYAWEDWQAFEASGAEWPAQPEVMVRVRAHVGVGEVLAAGNAWREVEESLRQVIGPAYREEPPFEWDQVWAEDEGWQEPEEGAEGERRCDSMDVGACTEPDDPANARAANCPLNCQRVAWEAIPLPVPPAAAVFNLDVVEGCWLWIDVAHQEQGQEGEEGEGSEEGEEGEGDDAFTVGGGSGLASDARAAATEGSDRNFMVIIISLSFVVLVGLGLCYIGMKTRALYSAVLRIEGGDAEYKPAAAKPSTSRFALRGAIRSPKPASSSSIQ